MEYKDEEWLESLVIGGTPGHENSLISGDFENSTDGENNTNNSSNQSCKAVIVVYTNNDMYNNSEKVSIYFSVLNNTLPFLIEYWVEDLSGNIAKSPYNTTNTNAKSWTPRIDEDDKVFKVKARLYQNCSGTEQIAESEETIIVIGDMTDTETTIDIEEMYLGTDNKIEFGQPLRARFRIYKGDESKSSVEFWIEDSSNQKISQTSKALFYKKFTEYELTVPIQIKPNCNEKYNDGQYKLVAEGLDIRKEMGINVESITSSMCPSSSSSSSSSSTSSGSSSSSSSTANSKINYQLLNFNNNFESGKETTTELLIHNDNEGHSFEIWSYIYKGSKSYSGDREENKQIVELSAGESAIIELRNYIEAKPDEYKFKIKIKKDSQKTNKELTEDVIIIEKTHENGVSQKTIDKNLIESLEIFPNSNKAPNKITGNVVYESQSAKSKKIAPILFLAAVFILAIIMIKQAKPIRKLIQKL